MWLKLSVKKICRADNIMYTCGHSNNLVVEKHEKLGHGQSALMWGRGYCAIAGRNCLITPWPCVRRPVPLSSAGYGFVRNVGYTL